MAVSGIILAGGRSSRMGQDKSLLRVNNASLIERTVREMECVTAEIIIAGNAIGKYRLPNTVEVADLYPGMGPLAGLHAGLKAAKYHYSFIISCDMPFFTKDLAAFLLAHREGYDAVVPKIKGHFEPLCAVYSRACIKPIENCLANNIKRVYQFYSQVKVLEISDNDRSFPGDPDKLFLNLNTREQLQALFPNNNVR